MNESVANRSNRFKRDDVNDSINQPPTDRDFENDVIRPVNNNSKSAGKENLRQKSSSRRK